MFCAEARKTDRYDDSEKNFQIAHYQCLVRMPLRFDLGGFLGAGPSAG